MFYYMYIFYKHTHLHCCALCLNLDKKITPHKVRLGSDKMKYIIAIINWIGSNWLGVLGTILSFAGIIMSFVAIKKSNNAKKYVDNQIKNAKINDCFISKHPEFVSSIQTHITSLKENSTKSYILNSITGDVNRIFQFSASWELPDKDFLSEFKKHLSNLNNDNFKEEKYREDVLNKLIELNNILERIGELNGIRQN